MCWRELKKKNRTMVFRKECLRRPEIWQTALLQRGKSPKSQTRPVWNSHVRKASWKRPFSKSQTISRLFGAPRPDSVTTPLSKRIVSAGRCNECALALLTTKSAKRLIPQRLRKCPPPFASWTFPAAPNKIVPGAPMKRAGSFSKKRGAGGC